MREAYIICEVDIIASAISSVTAGNGYHCKNPPLSIDKGGFLRGAGDRTRTGTLSPAVDFESTTSTNSITPAGVDNTIP